jgi:ElaA protein
MNIEWICKKFNELAPFELYSIMQLRNEVFVVEQNCVYQDADNKDISSWHFMGWENKKLAAYVRILPPGLSYAEASIGRVVTSPLYRRTGAGRLLMQNAIAQSQNLFNTNSIKIGAQLYLKKFYESLGFKQCSELYMEDGIEHIEMIRHS